MTLSDDENRRLEELGRDLEAGSQRRRPQRPEVASAHQSAVLAAAGTGLGVLAGLCALLLGLQHPTDLGIASGVSSYLVIVLSVNFGVTTVRRRRRAPGPDGAVPAGKALPAP